MVLHYLKTQSCKYEWEESSLVLHVEALSGDKPNIQKQEAGAAWVLM